MPAVYQTLQSQNKLKTYYALFWSYYGLGHLDQNKTIRGCPQGIVCQLGQDQMGYDLLTILGVTEILFSFRVVLEGKTGKKIPESLRLEFLEKFLANNFALSDVEDNTSQPMKRGGIAGLSLLRTLLRAIDQKS